MNYLSPLVHDLIVRCKRLIRNPSNIVWAIIVPIVIVSIVGYILPNDDGIAAVYVQNKDGSLYSHLVVGMLVREYSATIIDKDADTQAAIEEIDAQNPGQIRIIIVIPQNFYQYVQKYKNGEEFQVQLTSNGLSFVMDMMKAIDEDYDDGSVHLTIHTDNSTNLIGRTYKTLNNNLIKQVSPGITVTLILMVTSSLVTVVFREEREQRLDTLLRNSGFNRGMQVISVTIWALLPSVIVLLFSYITMRFFLDITFDDRIVTALILSSTFSVAMGMFICELIRNGQVIFVANTSLQLAMLLLCGGIFPKELLSQRILDAGQYVPATYLIEMVNCSMGFGGDFAHSALMAFGFIIGIFAAWYLLVKVHERHM